MYIRHGPQLQLAFNVVQEYGIFINKKWKRGILLLHTKQYNTRVAQAVSVMQSSKERELYGIEWSKKLAWVGLRKKWGKKRTYQTSEVTTRKAKKAKEVFKGV